MSFRLLKGSILVTSLQNKSMGTRGRSITYTTEDVLRVFKQRSDSYEPMTSSEIAESLGCSRQTAANRLEELSEEDDLETKKVGARGRVWWLPEEYY
jgi:predicted ArsR family transcriptional regulator